MIKRKTSFWQENKFIVFAFLSTAITMFIIFMCNLMVPLGDKTILRMDLYHQYGPLFAELYERVMNGDSLTYSWISGLGSCFLGNYFNYLSSPIGAIVLFFGHNNVPDAIAAMILIKAALSASTFTYYIKRSLKNQSYATVAFGVMYAFCAYMLAYYWNVMWLDAMVLLPIIVLGIERIINHGKMATYITGLALTMFSNYYMSYMLCVFSVIYFIYYYSANYNLDSLLDSNYKKKIPFVNKRFFASGFRFAIASLCAAGLMAVILLPVYSILKSCSATSDPFPKEIESYFSFFDFFANHFASLTTTIRSSGEDVLPNVYCGVATLILAPLYFFTKTISKKEKVATLILLATLYFSFNFNFLNFIWHGLHFPNDLPYRQSFIYSFILLTMAYKTFLRLGEFSSRQIGAVGVAVVSFVFFTEKLTSKNVTDGTILLTLCLTVLYVVVLTILKDKKYQTASVALMLLICICCEAVMCDTSTLNISVDKKPYTSDLQQFEQIKDGLDTIEQDDFYRMELTNLRTRMDPSWYYYNGVSVFSSMAYEKLSNLQDNLGMMSNGINSYTYNPQTPIYNMMFSLKYIVNNEVPNIIEGSPNYKSVLSNDKFHAYRNNYYLPIAYCVDSFTENWANESYIDSWENQGSDPFILQGDYFKFATGTENPFEKVEVSYVTYSNVNPFYEGLDSYIFSYNKTTPDIDGSSVFYFTTEKDGNVYIYFEDSNTSNSKDVTINSPLGTLTHSMYHNCILDVGYLKANQTVTLTVPYDSNSGTVKVAGYTVNDKLMKKGHNILKESQMLIDTFEDNYIKGKVTTDKDCLLYTSIPYDEGWSVFVNGEKVSADDIVKLGNALLAVKLKRGIHEVEFRFTPKLLKEGATITTITTVIVILFCIMMYLLKKKGIKNFIPVFAAADNSFTDDIYYTFSEPITEKKTASVETPSTKFVDVYSNSKIKREIIIPPYTIKMEMITPPNITVTDVDADTSSENE